MKTFTLQVTKTFLALFLVSITVLSSCKPEEKGDDPTPVVPGTPVNPVTPVDPGKPVVTEEKNTWAEKAKFPGVSRKEAASFAIGDNLYLGTGLGKGANGQEFLNDFWQYNTTTNTWSRKADFPGGPIGQAISFSINGKGYLALGYRVECFSKSICDKVYFNKIWEYTPTSDSWRFVADFTELGFGYQGAAFVINNKAYILNYDRLDEFDPVTNKITLKAAPPNYPHPFGYTVAFSIEHRGYVGTGYSEGFIKSFYEYDPATDKWTQKADFAGEARYKAFGFALNGKGYIGSGIEGEQQGDEIYSDWWQYDPKTDNWKLAKSYQGKGRFSITGQVINGKAYIGTGASARNLIDYESDFWAYNPE